MKKIIIISLLIYLPLIGQEAEWQTVGEMPIAVAGGRAVVCDSLIFIMGGRQQQGYLNDGSDVVQVYSPAKNSWRIEKGLLAKRYGLVANRYNNSIISFGGILRPSSDQTSIEMWDFINAPRFLFYHPAFSRHFATGHIYGDDFYVIGGVLVLTNDTSTSYIIKYNMLTNTVTEVYQGQYTDEFPFQQMSVLHHDNIYLFGGISFSVSNKVFKFNCTSNEYTQIQPNLSIERAGGAAVLTPTNDVYIIGGLSEADLAQSTVEIYHLEDDSSSYSISTGRPLNVGRRELMAAYYNNGIYVFGGMTKFNKLSASVELLKLPGNKVKEHEPHLIDHFSLAANYPNPFSPQKDHSATVISFEIGRSSAVRVEIYSIMGRHIRTLVNEKLSANEYRVTWDGTDEKQLPVASGVYIYQLTTEYQSLAKKMILAR